MTEIAKAQQKTIRLYFQEGHPKFPDYLGILPQEFPTNGQAMNKGKFERLIKRMLAVLLGATFFVPSVYAVEDATETKIPVSGDAATLAHGERVYAKYCALCHGASGEGYAADNANALANQDFLVSVSDTFLWKSIAIGRPGTAMAAHARTYGGPLEEADIDALVTLIRAWQLEPSLDIGNAPVLGDPVSGRAAYDQFCIACHGDQGQGVTAVSLNNPEFQALASDAQIHTAITHGRRGTPMAAFRDVLEDDTIDDLVALIRSWKRDAPQRAEVPASLEFPDLVINPDGPMPQFSLREGRYVSSAQVDSAMRDGARMILLDARPRSDWYLAHIPGAVSAPAYDPDSIIVLLPDDDTWIISYCACPHKYSDQLTDALRDAGFDNTAVLDEGVTWWQRKGYPIAYGP
jgi:cytochrome c oxidase cbb3-type subunit 3/ubiquinol-cytochrome c reductase cytochrome c subunit